MTTDVAQDIQDVAVRPFARIVLPTRAGAYPVTSRYPQHSSVPSIIRELVTVFGISEGELGELLGLPPMNRRNGVSHWKNCSQRMSPLYLTRIIKLYSLHYTYGYDLQRDPRTHRFIFVLARPTPLTESLKLPKVLSSDWEEMVA